MRILHGVNIDAHLEILFATTRGLRGNEDGYNKIPLVKVIHRKAKQNRYGVAWPGRYGRPQYNHKASILLNIIPGHDCFDIIETLCHEVAHLLAPRHANHGHGWKMCYMALAEQAYGIQIPYNEFGRFVGILAPKLRERARLGTLGVGSELAA